MVLTNITGDEKKRFEKFQKEGLLPSAALRKIEAERRLGVTEEEGFFTEDNVFKIGVGAIGIAILYTYMKARTPSTPQTASMSLNNNLENIPGIDLDALSTCREKGLI